MTKTLTAPAEETTPTLTPEQAAVAAVTPEQLEAVRLYVADKVIRLARRKKWCRETEVEQSLAAAFGPRPAGEKWVDSDGVSCDGRDKDGYDADGYDARGYGRDGFSKRGYDRDGYDREGFDQYDGVNRDGLTREEWYLTPEGKQVKAQRTLDSLGGEAFIALIAAAVAAPKV
jgi:hypothetical protein